MDREKLVRIIRNCSSWPLPPLSPPPLPPEWEPLVFPPAAPPAILPAAVSGGGPAAPPTPDGQPVRAVLFDIYGTLFRSAAGEIGAAVDDDAAGPGGEGRGRRDALAALAREFAPGFSAGDLTGYFRRRVMEIHAERAGEVRYPEVRVEDIWAGFPGRFSPEGRGAAAGTADPGGRGQNRPAALRAKSPRGFAREFALRYELAVNPAVPLPGAAETIASLRESGVLLGLVSNAQFFTPLLFDAFFGASPEGLGFDPALIVYSCDMGEAKPSPALFGQAAAELARRGIDPGACVYAGNDMRNDLLGAAAAGWKTVLFAGDPLSLRTRRGDPAVGDLKPWRIVRDLRDLAALLHIPAVTVPAGDGRKACLPPALCR